MKTQDKSYQLQSLHQKSEYSINPEPSQHKLVRQINNLKKQKKELLLMNSKFIDSSTEMEQFFIDTVNEIKKNINIRRDIKDCKLSDFKKEDKI